MKIAAFLAGILFLISPCFAAPLVCPPDVVDSSGTGKAVLFSSLPLDKTEFAVRWSSALPELKKEFPTLRFEKTENLHITLAFMGVGGWKPAKVEEMERYALDGPDLSSGPVTLKGSPDLFGPKKNVVVLHFTSAPPEWGKRLMKDRQTMTDKDLRKRDMFDDVFKAHMSLAFARSPETPPAELARFEAWLAAHAAGLNGLAVLLDKSIKPALYVVLDKDDAVRFVPLRAYCPAAPL